MAYATKSLPQKDGLDQRFVIVRFNVNDDSKRIQLIGYVETLSPNGNVIKRSDEEHFIIIENKPAIMGKGERPLITPEEKDEEGNIIQKAVYGPAPDIEITPTDPAYDNLKSSEVGQTIYQMIQDKINSIS